MIEHDVVIIGAGVSGLGVAVHLQDKHPEKDYVILDGRDGIGGTWNLFRYPGIRSDSDLHTYAFAFKPWISEKALADGPSIMSYLEEAADENDLRRRIRFGHSVTAAHWSSAAARWTIVARRTDGELVEIRARWLVSGTGYFRYDRGYTPAIPGLEQFEGTVVHPSEWPEDLDYADRRVVVIGSGATAVTLVPEMSRTANHVTMLQRTPTYMMSAPPTDRVFQVARRLFGPARAHRITRRKNLFRDDVSYRLIRRFPDHSARLFRMMMRKELPPGYDAGTHFNPPYAPWDQRVCVVLDGDLFKAVGEGRVSMVTDRISEVTGSGIRLESGATLEADVIVTATGLELIPMGGVDYTVDGTPIDISEAVTYKSTMLSGMPNFAYVFGYVNASWTLKVDLVADHLCRLLSLMDEREYDFAVPEAPDPALPTVPMLNDLTAGYVLRSVDRFPRQGTTAPWLAKMDFVYDRKVLVEAPVGDHIRFGRADEVPVSEGRSSAAASA